MSTPTHSALHYWPSRGRVARMRRCPKLLLSRLLTFLFSPHVRVIVLQPLLLVVNLC